MHRYSPMTVREHPPAPAEAGSFTSPERSFLDTLIDEHRVIARTLDALESFVVKGDAGGSLDLFELGRFVVFFREFAELAHHAKEERVLFPAMVKLGYSMSGAPIAHIHAEHRREQGLLFEIRQASMRARPLSSAKYAHLVGLVHELIAFERRHIKKENELLYPAIMKELSGKSLRDLTQNHWTNEDAERSLAEDAWLRSLAAELARAHPVVR
jgi:hemerythrin-like domain-containing protein